MISNTIKPFRLFTELNGFKDSEELLLDCKDTMLKEITNDSSISYRDIDKGSVFTFGSYEQDGNSKNGKEPIEWQVIAKEDNRILIISKYALDCKDYNEIEKDVTWETCTLRSWLNDDFYNTAFSEDEQKYIPTVTVTADGNPYYYTNPGNDTRDKIFLFSINEAYEYFLSDDERICKPTKQAVKNGVYTSYVGNCWWWLRDIGGEQYKAALVGKGGAIDEGGFVVDDNHFIGVRPSMWIEIK